MGLIQISLPTFEPVSLVEAKAHLRVTFSDDDNVITAFIAAARMNVEGWLGRALVDQTWDLYLDSFPTDTFKGIQIPLPPLLEVISVKYDDGGGVEQTVSPTAYYVDKASQPGWIVPVGVGASWPTPIDAINSVRIRFRAGYITNNSPPEQIPFDIKAGMLLTVGSMYEHRESQVVGTIANKLPFGVEQLLRRHRVLLGMS